ncbi:peptidase S26A, signal peptidase I [Thiobacillus denitrificans ATCC 25259]|uniref:Signal peptidase I n=1 Tax=Thiobacillus denitrificans (strain ATCC 25259 / T1) TaxID=292415 RepID=Q3SH48_THIDA|nr:signal peptidase I [Thiobacillus denitrificans]AAZ98041.1 peptidase S26A, signal peptidase I [Thiobacillus denitrificans ATCC 25259]
MNFALILFVALVVTGGIWLLDALLLKRGRDKDAREPLLVEYAKSFFPVILIVFGLRSFLVEPFKIPSGSMMPTLLIGDFILVNKYTYGIRLPVINKKIVQLNNPERGDVMVFRYPADPGLDYIKRVVGVPGDVVEYREKKLSVNGRAVPVRNTGTYSYVGNGLNYITAMVYDERLNGTGHTMMVEPGKPSVASAQVMDFPQRENCSYNADGEGFVCKVPPGQYFMMGDNRDASNDSRYWGFVPDRNIVGKAFFIWMNFDDFGRIGTTIR